MKPAVEIMEHIPEISQCLSGCVTDGNSARNSATDWYNRDYSIAPGSVKAACVCANVCVWLCFLIKCLLSDSKCPTLPHLVLIQIKQKCWSETTVRTLIIIAPSALPLIGRLASASACFSAQTWNKLISSSP